MKTAIPISGETPTPIYVKQAMSNGAVATITHGLPGVVIGGVIMAGIAANHVFHQIWNAMPIILCASLCFFALVWVVSLFERYLVLRRAKEIDSDTFSVALMLAMVLSIVGFISTCVTWNWAHPGPPDNSRQTSCTGHGGVSDLPITKVQNNSRYDSVVTVVNCRDGSGFQR